MLPEDVIYVIEIIGRFIEMRGISIISVLLIGFLFKLDLDQRKQINNLKCDLEVARKGLDRKIEKYLEHNNNLMLELKVDVGKMSESIKAICVTLEDIKRDRRGK